MSLYAACVGGRQTLHTDQNQDRSTLREPIVMVLTDAAGLSLSALHKQRTFPQELMFPSRRVMKLSTWWMSKSYAVNGDCGYGIILYLWRIRTSYFQRIRTSYFYFHLRGILNGTINDTTSKHLTQSDPPWHMLNLNQHKHFASRRVSNLPRCVGYYVRVWHQFGWLISMYLRQ